MIEQNNAVRKQQTGLPVLLIVIDVINAKPQMLRDAISRPDHRMLSFAAKNRPRASASATECIRRLERENTLKRGALQAVRIIL